MEQYKEIIEAEETRCTNMIEEMRSVLEVEQKDRIKKSCEISELKQKKLDSHDWREKDELENLINMAKGGLASRNFQNHKILRKPYFGVLVLDDEDLGRLTYCLGPSSFFGEHGQVLVIDWRDAPVSRLYYEYDAGEEYGEEIRGRERYGLVQTKRQVEISHGDLKTITEKGLLLAKGADNTWESVKETRGATQRKENKKDHRLPEITALISREQFLAITRKTSGTFLLQGGAGSGKTTVGLHRIAFLTYDDTQRFQPARILVVMFNKSLQTYISGVLPELGVGPGVQIRTYHNWAGSIFKACRIKITYSNTTAPDFITRFKKSATPLYMVDHYLDLLLARSKEWLIDKSIIYSDPEAGKIRAFVEPLETMEELYTMLCSNGIFNAEHAQPRRTTLKNQLLNRLNNHGEDLFKALTDPDALETMLQSPTSGLTPNLAGELSRWQHALRQRGEMDFADTGLLLYILQRKGIPAALPELAHIMVDEAQDFSPVELATIIMAADEDQSITICGDMAQKIKGDVVFKTPQGFAGFVKELQEKQGYSNLSAETLSVGYRATRQIMEMALHVLQKHPVMAAPREGEPVKFIIKNSTEEVMNTVSAALSDYIQHRPAALVGVVCKYKSHADQVFDALKRRNTPLVRRHQRNDFSFQPGIIVTNAHQVKGLEFSAVAVINPSPSQYRDNPEDRMLLHVVMTRASDKLWIAGHETPAYTIMPSD